MDLARQAKAIAGLAVVAVGESLTFGVLPESWRPYAQVVIAVGAYAGIYGTRNATSAPPPRAEPAEPPPPSRIADERPQNQPRRPTG
jgi:hypothetical protein